MTGARMTEASEATGFSAEAGKDWLVGALATLRQRLWLVALFGAVALLGGVIYLRTTTYSYTASMKIAAAPTTAREGGSLGALNSLASLTGITIEALPVTPFRLYIEGINSREVATRLAADPALMHAIFAKEWDAAGGQWRDPGGFGTRLSDGMKGLAGAPVKPWSPPDAARLQQWIGEHVSIDQSPKTPIVTISVVSPDRALGITVLGRLHAAIDSWLRERTLARTTANIRYLTQKLSTVALADHRLALIATLNEQEQRLMLARNPAAYAAERFGPVTATPQPTSPRQIPVLVVALMLGLGAGVGAALLLPRRRQPAGA
jgi:hypothetical protein